MVAILGGGIAGLTAAFELENNNIDFELFEASEHTGGKIKSERVNGFLIEHGPNSLHASSDLIQRIIEQCDLAQHRVFASETASNRFVVRKNEPVPLPANPPQLLTSNYFSLGTKIRLAREPFIGKPPHRLEESIAQFVRRRLGKEVLDYAVDPFVTGIFAGDPERLSIKHAFPSLVELEDNHGSLLRGLLSERNKEKASSGRRIFSFAEGIQMLPDAITESFKNRIHTGSRVISVVPAGKRWRVDIARGNHEETRHFDAVLSTIPLPALTDIHLEVDFDLTPLSNVYYPPVRVIAMGFERDDIMHPLDGFGMLVPGCEASKRILGTIFTSSVFPGHAPEGKVLLTTLIGGARHADLNLLEDGILEELVLTDLDELLGVYGDPIFVRHIQWEKAIPQYNLGYGVVKALLNNIEAMYPGLFFAGNYRQGISVADAMQSGSDAVERIIQTP